MRKQRPIPDFAGLTPDQKTQLYSWFQRGYTYDQLCAMVAQPAPEGFGLKVSKDKMFRYYHRWQEIQELQKEDNSITVEAYEAFMNGDPGQLAADSIQRIKAQAFLMTMQEQSDPAQLLKLLHVFDFENARHLSERRQYYKERQQQFSERRLERNARLSSVTSVQEDLSSVISMKEDQQVARAYLNQHPNSTASDSP